MDDATREVRGRVPAKPETLKFVVEAMRRTANGGTAKVVGRKDADMGGKTGTAQVVKLKMAAGDRRLKMSEMEYAQRDHAWIATWGVKDGKTYVVIVMVEHGGGGSSVAGPVARKVYDYLFGPDPNAPMIVLPAPTAAVEPAPRTGANNVCSNGKSAANNRSKARHGQGVLRCGAAAHGQAFSDHPATTHS